MAISLIVVEMLALVFWLRGLYRRCKADVVFGWVLLLIALGLCLQGSWGHPGSLSLPLSAFGLVNLAVSFDSRLKTAIVAADHLRLLGLVCLLLAFACAIML